MKSIKTIFSAPAFWIGLCFAILGYLQVVYPNKQKPMTEAQRKDQESMMVNFAL